MNTSTKARVLWLPHRLQHNGSAIVLRSFSPTENHHDLRFINQIEILRPSPPGEVIGSFSRDEVETAAAIAADYFSWGKASDDQPTATSHWIDTRTGASSSPRSP